MEALPQNEESDHPCADHACLLQILRLLDAGSFREALQQQLRSSLRPPQVLAVDVGRIENKAHKSQQHAWREIGQKTVEGNLSK